MKNKRRKSLLVNGKQIYQYRLITERALGKPLPVGCEVHHHTDIQLVICQDRAYHCLLHRRMRALRACGHASWRICNFCKQYDKPENLKLYGRHACHGSCRVIYSAHYRRTHKRKESKIIRFMKIVLDK